MNRSGPGATHHLACDCRERKWAERLAGADRALYAERERVVRAELRAASLSCELLDAMQARDRLAERAVTMQLMLDTIEGWATGQPGKMPTAVEDGWSTALSAAVARLAAAESRAARLLTALKHLLKAFLMLHRACGTGSAEQWPEVEDARAAIAAEREERGKEKGNGQC